VTPRWCPFDEVADLYEIDHVKGKKRPKLPPGLRWHSKSQFIWFIWYDARGRQHKKSTETTDPDKALLFKIRFLEEQEDREEGEGEPETPDMKNMSLERAAQLFFEWKLANNSAETVAREQRMFKNVVKFLGPNIPVRSIRLLKIRQYQKERRKQISPTMKKAVGPRTINYELQLLRGVITYADCWTSDLEARYQPLRQAKNRVGKAATKDQLIKIINTALGNDYWHVAMCCAAIAAGSGCRGGEIRKLRLADIFLDEGRVRIVREIAKNRKEREPRLMALAEWGFEQLLLRAQALGATEPHHYLLPLEVSKSRHAAKKAASERDAAEALSLQVPKSRLAGKKRGPMWDVNQPMQSWVKSWRKLMEACGMTGFRFHDLRHTFRTQGAEAGVPLEVMMAQLGHMDRETSLEYVHIQQRALERAKQLIESEQAEILAAAQNKRSGEIDGKTAVAAAAGDQDNHAVTLPPPATEAARGAGGTGLRPEARLQCRNRMGSPRGIPAGASGKRFDQSFTRDEKSIV
jgi:integrase